MKYRIYFNAKDITNGIKDFDTVDKLLDFISEMSYGFITDGDFDKDGIFCSKSSVSKKDSFIIHSTSKIEEEELILDIGEAIENGKKLAEEEAKMLDEKFYKYEKYRAEKYRAEKSTEKGN